MPANQPAVRFCFPILLMMVLSGCLFGGADTPLGRAAAKVDLDAMKGLLDHGADPNALGAFGMTPMAAAARKGSETSSSVASPSAAAAAAPAEVVAAAGDAGVAPARADHSVRRGAAQEAHAFAWSLDCERRPSAGATP